MERLREKGYLARTKEGPVHRYAPSEPASDLLRGLVRDFVQKALGGSVSPFVAYLAEDADLSPAELADEKVLLAVAVDVGPAGGRIAGALDPDRHTVRLETDRWLELCGAAEGKPSAYQER